MTVPFTYIVPGLTGKCDSIESLVPVLRSCVLNDLLFVRKNLTVDLSVVRGGEGGRWEVFADININNSLSSPSHHDEAPSHQTLSASRPAILSTSS